MTAWAIRVPDRHIFRLGNHSFQILLVRELIVYITGGSA